MVAISPSPDGSYQNDFLMETPNKKEKEKIPRDQASRLQTKEQSKMMNCGMLCMIDNEDIHQLWFIYQKGRSGWKSIPIACSSSPVLAIWQCVTSLSAISPTGPINLLPMHLTTKVPLTQIQEAPPHLKQVWNRQPTRNAGWKKGITGHTCHGIFWTTKKQHDHGIHRPTKTETDKSRTGW